MANQTRRIASGFYEIDTVAGTFEIAMSPGHVQAENGHGNKAAWYITWPDCYTEGGKGDCCRGSQVTRHASPPFLAGGFSNSTRTLGVVR